MLIPTESRDRRPIYGSLVYFLFVFFSHCGEHPPLLWLRRSVLHVFIYISCGTPHHSHLDVESCLLSQGQLQKYVAELPRRYHDSSKTDLSRHFDSLIRSSRAKCRACYSNMHHT